jgi:putative transposase
MEPSDAKRLRALEDENGKLKKLLAEQMFPSQALLRNILLGKGQYDVARHQLKKMVTPAVRREAVVYLCEANNVSYAAAPAGDCITPQACFQHDAICREGAGV